ncbi:MAG: PAS domain-containing protein [Chlorobiaceae bacterium]|nr:PAS domain-containing protein [Chlorobiaceae bacterium]
MSDIPLPASQVDLAFSTLLESHPDAICLLDPKGTIVRINSVFASRFGRKPHECVGADIYDLISNIRQMPDIALRRKKQCEEVLRLGKKIEFEDVRGSYITRISINPVKSTDNEISLLIIICQDISEQKHLEQALCENETRFNHAIKLTRTGVWEWDLKTNENFWSPELWQLYGMELNRQPPSFELWAGTVHPDDREMAIRAVESAVNNETELNLEYRVSYPDGSTHWLMSRGLPLRNANGRAIRYFGIVIDITDRKHIEDELSEYQKRMEFALEKSHVGVWDLDLQDHKAIRTIEHARIFGYVNNLQEWSMEKFLDHIVEEDRDRIRSLIRRSIEIRQDFSFECRICRSDGEIRWIAATGALKFDNDGATSHIMGVVKDITELKQSLELIIEGDSRMHYIMAATNAGLWEIESGSSLCVWSEEIWGLYGIEPYSCKPSYENWLKTIIPSDRERVDRSAREAERAGIEFNGIWRVQNADGTIRWLLSKGRPFKDPEGRVLKYVGIVIDVTDRKKEELDKQQLETQLRRTRRLETIGTLAGGIAHDFNNILTPILGYSEMGLSDFPPEDPMHEYFSEIMHAANRAQTLIAQILTFSRSEEVSRSVVNVQSIIEEALKLLRPSIPSTITIEQSIQENCRNILADPSQIHQVIVNLCANAFQAMQQTVGVIRIALKEIVSDADLRKSTPQLTESDYLLLSISDTGSGMDESVMEHIFEPFFTTKGKNRGTGLGLSVVHGIVTGCKGAITVESTPGSGTTFSIYLPVINEKIEVPDDEKPFMKGSSRILLVDDEESGTRMMKIMLTKLGFSVQTSNSPKEAIARFRQNPENFDLVITDLTMPEMNGTDLAIEIHKLNSGIPIILLTGYEKDLGDILSLRKFGISRCLKKPVKMALLPSIINEVISGATG